MFDLNPNERLYHKDLTLNLLSQWQRDRTLKAEYINKDFSTRLPSCKLTVRHGKSPCFLGFIPSKWCKIFQGLLLLVSNKVR